LFRLLILGALIWLIWRTLKPAPRRTPERPPTRVADTVRCAACGTHLPSNEALRDGDQWYCSEAHRLAARGDRPNDG